MVKSSELIWNLAEFKAGSLRVPGCEQVAGLRRGVGRAGLGATGAPFWASQIGLDFLA